MTTHATHYARAEPGPIEILLVEDNPGDVRLTVEAFSGSAMANHFTVASDGELALAMLRHEAPYEDAARPDIILLDLNLPKRDGREVLAEIKQDADLHRIPVIVLTTSWAERDVAATYDLNANCYIVKPVDFEDFIAAVRSIETFWFSTVKLPPR